LLFLEDTNLNQGVAFSEKLRDEIANYPFNYEGQKINITMTFGVSEYDEGSDLKETIKRADQALYKGKECGKNKVIDSRCYKT
jgi:diguanylate cyclase (GGDEF)-like protein